MSLKNQKSEPQKKLQQSGFRSFCRSLQKFSPVAGEQPASLRPHYSDSQTAAGVQSLFSVVAQAGRGVVLERNNSGDLHGFQGVETWFGPLHHSPVDGERLMWWCFLSVVHNYFFSFFHVEKIIYFDFQNLNSNLLIFGGMSFKSRGWIHWWSQQPCNLFFSTYRNSCCGDKQSKV